MADELTQADASSLADRILGFGRGSDEEIIERVAAEQPDEAAGAWDNTGDDPITRPAEPGEVVSGCPDDHDAPNPWNRLG